MLSAQEALPEPPYGSGDLGGDDDSVGRRSRTLAAAAAIRRGATALASRARVERAGELTLNQTGVLGLLVRAGLLTPTEVAERMHVSLPSLTRTLASLQEADLISRMPDPRDRRQSMLAISETGRAALRDEMRPRDEWVAAVLDDHVTETERDVLVAAARLMERLAEIDLFPGVAELPPEARTGSHGSAVR